jgi:hypothetical protein
VIIFKIKFPTTMDNKSAALIQDALNGTAIAASKGGAAKTAGGKGATPDSDIAETCELKQFVEEHRNTDHRGGQSGTHHDSDNEEEEDEDGHGHGQRVGCQQQ